MCVGRFTDRVSYTNSSEELSVKKIRVKQACERAGRPVAALYEYCGECFGRGWKVRSRYGIHSGEEGKE